MNCSFSWFRQSCLLLLFFVFLLLLLASCFTAAAKKQPSSSESNNNSNSNSRSSNHVSKCCGITDSKKLWDCLMHETEAYSNQLLASSASSMKPVELIVVTDAAQAALWVDADLTVLNMSTTVHDFYHQALSSSKDPHFYICAERQGKSTINSGSFLVRNTDTGRELLQTWWNASNRTLHDDQEALDQIMLGHRKHFIHVLHPSFFNSDPPAMTALSPSDRAIHLMGEIEPYRKQVFQTALMESCRAYQQKQEPSPLLGITRSYLLDTVLTVHQIEYDEIMHNDHSMPIHASNLDEFTKEVTRVSHTLTYAMDYMGISLRANQIKCEVFRRFCDVVDRYRREGNDLESVSCKLNFGIQCMNSMESLHNLQTTYAYLRQDFTPLHKDAHFRQVRNILWQEIQLEEAMAKQYIKRQMWDEALEKQLTAVTLLTRHKFSKNYLVEYWETLAGLLCATRRNVLAFPIFEETIAIRIQRFGSNHPSLATTYFNMGTCKFQAQMYPQAVQDLKKCLDVLDDSNVPSTDETRLRAATFYKEANDVIQRLQRPPAVQESNYYYNEKEL